MTCMECPSLPTQMEPACWHNLEVSGRWGPLQGRGNLRVMAAGKLIGKPV